LWELLFIRYHGPPSSGVNFINVLLAAFACADPESTKKTDNLTVLFGLSGSARAKAARRMLMKLTPGRAIFPYEFR